MLKTSEDLLSLVNSKIIDNGRNQITAADLRQVLYDLLDSTLEPSKAYKVNNVTEFLTLIDTLYALLIQRLGKTVLVEDAFSLKQYEIIIGDGTGLLTEMTTPAGRTVTLELNGYTTQIGKTIYLKYDMESAAWHFLFAIPEDFCSQAVAYDLDGDDIISCEDVNPSADYYSLSNVEYLENTIYT